MAFAFVENSKGDEFAYEIDDVADVSSIVMKSVKSEVRPFRIWRMENVCFLPERKLRVNKFRGE